MSWIIGTNPDAELVNIMLDAVIETVADTPDRPMVHFNRGRHGGFNQSSQHFNHGCVYGSIWEMNATVDWSSFDARQSDGFGSRSQLELPARSQPRSLVSRSLQVHGGSLSPVDYWVSHGNAG